MRIMSVIGARPEFIKAGPVSRAFARGGIEEILVHTGQHYDEAMSDVFFEALGLRLPDYNLGAGSGSHGQQTGSMIQALERLLVEHPMDGVLVYGDTNSTLAGALAAVKLHVPVIHVEAGLRSFNRRMPEEINRVITDHVSTLLFSPTQTAVDNLANEGITEGVHLVGDVNQDALDYWVTSGNRQEATGRSGYEHGSYFVATVHRAENVDDPTRLSSIMTALNSLPKVVVLCLHPRTALALERLDLLRLENVHCIPPVGFLEMLELTQGAAAVLTDSGGLQKEAYMLGVPCITMREETEWIETVGTGWNKLVGSDGTAILQAAKQFELPSDRPPIFGDGHASDQIVDTITKSLGIR